MKKYLIFGGTGSLGKTLIRRLYKDSEIIVYSRDEMKQWTIRNEYSKVKTLKFEVGDIRDESRVEECILKHRPDVIIVASALKQVDTCELEPAESIKTNILGVKNVVDAVERYYSSQLNSTLLNMKVLLVSTDKATAPCNVYGMCKAISERVVTSRSARWDQPSGPKFLAVRYGNVLESRGSIIPLFKYQAELGKALTLTHRDMTRFLMTLDDSVDLILHTLGEGTSGDIWIPKLKSMKILDLAEIFSEISGTPIEMIPIRPGEKMHESLVSPTESIRTDKSLSTHYVIKPAYMQALHMDFFEYSSADDIMSKEELKSYLSRINVLNAELSSFTGPKIEEIRTTHDR